MAMQDVHESYQIVRRVQDAKKKFGTIGKGAVRQEKFTGIMGQVRQVKVFSFITSLATFFFQLAELKKMEEAAEARRTKVEEEEKKNDPENFR